MRMMNVLHMFVITSVHILHTPSYSFFHSYLYLWLLVSHTRPQA